MQKGQLAVDFLLAVIFFLVVFSYFLPFVNSLLKDSLYFLKKNDFENKAYSILKFQLNSPYDLNISCFSLQKDNNYLKNNDFNIGLLKNKVLCD